RLKLRNYPIGSDDCDVAPYVVQGNLPVLSKVCFPRVSVYDENALARRPPGKRRRIAGCAAGYKRFRCKMYRVFAVLLSPNDESPQLPGIAIALKLPAVLGVQKFGLRCRGEYIAELSVWMNACDKTSVIRHNGIVLPLPPIDCPHRPAALLLF